MFKPLKLVLFLAISVISSVVKATATDDATPIFTLSTIEVTAEQPVDLSDTGNRIGLPPLENAQSSSVIDDEIIDDQQANTVDDILKNDASISNKGNFGATSSFSSRGFTLNNSGNYLRNGLLYFFFDVPPVESIDRVEILKGPASFLYGAGSPGGMINFITKKPMDEAFIQGGAQAGSWNYYRGYADVNQNLTEDFNARLNLAWEETDSFRDHYFHNRQLFDFSVDGETFENTDTLFNFTYQNTNQPQDTGLVAIGNQVADLPRSDFLNQTWTKTDIDSISTSLDSYTDLINDWTLHSAVYYQYVDRERKQSNLRMHEDSTGDFQYLMLHRVDTWNYTTALAELLSEKQFLGFDQKLLFGLNYALMDHNILETKSIVSDTYSIYDPPTLPEPDFGEFLDPLGTDTYDLGLYAQDVVTLHPQWEFIMGARFDHYQSHSSVLNDSSANNISPHFALLYKPLNFWSVYTSYTEGFEFNEPVSDANAVNFGDPLDPTLSEQIELGTKMELFDERLLFTAALFDILRYNQVVTEDFGDAFNEVIVTQRGEQHNQGLELGAQGILNDNLTLLSSLMWLDARFSEAGNPPDIAGNRPAAVPSLAATLWGEYRFDSGTLRNFALNSGVFYEGDRYGDDQNSFTLGSYARIDAGAAYYYPLEEDELVIRLNVENISDETYFYAYRRTNVTVGAPQSIWLTIEVN